MIPLKKRPSAADASQRLLVLRYVIIHGITSPPPDMLEEWMESWSDEDISSFRGELDKRRDEICESIRKSGLWSALTEDERSFVSLPGYKMTLQQLIDSAWRVEAAVCLMWSLNLLKSIPPYDEQTDSEILNQIPYEEPVDFVRKARLRNVKEIDRARNLAELWHWRSRTRELQEKGAEVDIPKEYDSLDDIVRASASYAVEAGDIHKSIEGDFPAFGKAYRDLDDEEWSFVRSISMEKHFSLNWLCGYAPGNRWDETPTDT